MAKHCLTCQCEPAPEDEFQSELQAMLSRHSKENGSNTQDFILTEFLAMCLRAWDYCTRYRDQVQGRAAMPGKTPMDAPDATA